MNKSHLISHHLCPYVQRAVIVLAEKGIEHRRTYIDLSNKPGWFVRLSPLGKVPVFQTGDTVLFESQVIAEYLDEVTPGSLHPDDPLEKARHRSWIEFGSQTLNAIGAFYNAKDRVAFEAARKDLRAKFERIGGELHGPYFSGERFHLVDGVWGTIFRYFNLFDQIHEFGFFDGLNAIQSWRYHIGERPSVASALPSGYEARLLQFLKERNSYLANMIPKKSNLATA